MGCQPTAPKCGRWLETQHETNPGGTVPLVQSVEGNTVKRTTDRTTKRTTWRRIVVGVALALALVPGTALAVGGGSHASGAAKLADADASVEARGDLQQTADDGSSRLLASNEGESDQQGAFTMGAEFDAAYSLAQAGLTKMVEQTDKTITYDPAVIAAIGTQESTGHSICCSSFSCAYADAVMDGTVRDHSYYSCSCCMWTDWGGGNSSFRDVGTDEQLLREAYDQIEAGKPTVVHVAADYGEHWITLIGYQDATDPDNLTLANFIALDPWDGAQITASDRFSLYGDGCEHVTERL